MCCTPSVAVSDQSSTLWGLATVISSAITYIHTRYNLFASSLPFPSSPPSSLPPALSPFRPLSPFPPVSSKSHTSLISSTHHILSPNPRFLACLSSHALPSHPLPSSSHPTPFPPLPSAPLPPLAPMRMRRIAVQSSYTDRVCVY